MTDRPLRLWILSLNYAPEPTGFAPHATALAEYFATRGHQVTVVTGFPFAPRWRRFAEYRRQWRSRQLQGGVVLNRITHFIPRRPGVAWQRLLMEATFAASALIALAPGLASRRRRPTAILYIGAQPAIAMLARGLAALNGCEYFVNINDLAARAAADVGILRGGWLQRALERFEFAAYLPAAGASVLCSSFGAALAAHGYPAERVRRIRSPVDIARIRPLAARAEYRQRLGLDADVFVVLQAGSMGLKQGLANVLEAARLQAQRRGGSPVTWALVGDGEMRLQLERLVAEYSLGDTVKLLPFQPEERMAEMLAAADVLLLNQLSTVADTVVPSKLLMYMAAGRPVLAAVNSASQGAEIVREANGGLLVAPDDPAALLAGVDALIGAGRNELAAMGARNRAYAELEFDQRRILVQHETFILERLNGVARSTRYAAA
jgi:putative colanic acid biosynthesis glycosyltransferase WcaI